jgi:hypothetical protein
MPGCRLAHAGSGSGTGVSKDIAYSPAASPSQPARPSSKTQYHSFQPPCAHFTCSRPTTAKCVERHTPSAPSCSGVASSMSAPMTPICSTSRSRRRMDARQ